MERSGSKRERSSGGKDEDQYKDWQELERSQKRFKPNDPETRKIVDRHGNHGEVLLAKPKRNMNPILNLIPRASGGKQYKFEYSVVGYNNSRPYIQIGKETDYPVFIDQFHNGINDRRALMYLGTKFSEVEPYANKITLLDIKEKNPFCNVAKKFNHMYELPGAQQFIAFYESCATYEVPGIGKIGFECGGYVLVQYSEYDIGLIGPTFSSIVGSIPYNQYHQSGGDIVYWKRPSIAGQTGHYLNHAFVHDALFGEVLRLCGVDMDTL